MKAEESPKHVEKYPVLEPGSRSHDRRVTEIKTYETPQTFHAPDRYSDWKERKEHLREILLNACGLWPMPEKELLQVEVFDRKEYDGYSVEKVLMRTLPGYYATGNLYRPLPKKAGDSQRYPGVLCPHGHWPAGRFADDERASVIRRCVSFAKQGYVCFSYDMVGYADNRKLLEHHFAGDREKVWGITPAGFQLWTSIRGLDFLQSLDDVDPEKIGCTGASGGGTQTFFLDAVDPRVKVSAPVNMISSTMQGGCDCENPPSIRLDSNNMEIGAMMAPRPMLMVSATGDWTKLTPTVEYPAVRSVYELYGVPQRVEWYQQKMNHNYNLASRQEVYRWFRKWFYPFRSPEHFVEPADLQVPASSELAIFPGHEIPKDALPKEQLFAKIREIDRKRFEKYLSGDPDEFRKTYGSAYRDTLAVEEPDPANIKVMSSKDFEVAPASPETGTWNLETFLLSNPVTGQEIPAHLWSPKSTTPDAAPVLLVHPEGKAALLDEQGFPTGSLKEYLDRGSPVLALDCMGTGEFVNDASATNRGERKGHFPTYNLTDTACRVQDILLGETYLAKRFGKPAEMVGLAGAGGWVLLAHGLADRSASTTVDLSGLDTTDDACFVNNLYIPNIRRVGDFVTSIILAGKRPVKITACQDETLRTRLDRAVKRTAES